MTECRQNVVSDLGLHCLPRPTVTVLSQYLGLLLYIHVQFKSCLIIFILGWFEINLDQRKLRTPGGNLFKVPHEALAMAVATEWNTQENVVKRHTMHLVITLAICHLLYLHFDY